MRRSVRWVRQSVVGGACMALSACRAPVADELVPVPAELRTTVLATVAEYVNGVSAKDTARMRAVLDPGARYDTYYADGADTGTVRSGTVESQLSGVASRSGVIRAHIWKSVVQVSDGIASIWTPYEVLVDGRIGWCGTDHFTLLKRPAGWRITSVNYTRRTTTCVPGPP